MLPMLIKASYKKKFMIFNLLDSIRAVAISKDNKYAASGASDCSVKLYDLITMQELHHFSEIHESNVV